MEARFSELSKVRIVHGDLPRWDGYVVEVREQGGRWLYRVSHADPEKPTDEEATFDNWYPEHWLEPA